MASSTNATQGSTISITQKLAITIEVEQTFDIENGAGLTPEQLAAITNANAFDINEIIASVLGQFNPASLGNTTVSGGLVSDTINSKNVTIDEIIFNNEGQVIDISQIELDISNLKTNISYITTSITEISSNLILFDNRLTQDISGLHIKLDSSFNALNNDISGLHIKLDSSFSNLVSIINDLSDTIDNIQSNIISISNIVEHFEISNNKMLLNLSLDISGLLITNNDFSFSYLNSLDYSSNIILSINQINELLGTYNFSTNNNSSFDISFTKEYVNDISQTFYEIMTQQPHKFDISGTPEASSSSITLSWNYDSILANINNSIVNARLANNSDLKLQQLPYIDNIKVDISGYNSNGWLNISNINIPNNISYNNETYKEFVIIKTNYSNDANINNLLTNSNPFDIRIYGINDAIDYPSIENRALIFEQLIFEAAQVPDKPIFRTSISQNESLTTLNLTFFVNETELGFYDSNALIDKLEVSYNLADTYRSSLYNNETISSPNTIDYSNPLYAKNTDFSITLNNLMPGSRYNFEARVQNNLNDNSFSEYSDLSLTNYTLLPGSNGINTNIVTNINGHKTRVTNLTTLDNDNIIYINLSDTNHNLMYENGNLQNIEITNPNASTTGSQAKGFGKLIDNSSNLVTINVYVDNISKQSIIFDGSFNNNYSVYNNNTINFIGSLDLIDMYNIDNTIYNDINEGLRLKGTLRLNNITNSDISSKIGNAQTTPHVLRYEYIRDSVVDDQYNQDDSYDIYIDDLSLDPVIDFTSNLTDTSCGVINTLYNMGIPSVMTFYLNFRRYYININSENLFIPGNRVISNISSISSTSITNDNDILLNINDIYDNAYDSTSNTNMSTLNNSIYNSINYSVSILAPDYSLNWIEKAYNLYKPNGINYDVSYVTNHYIDYNSFNKSNNKINSSKLNLNNIFLHEIDNISLLGSNLFGLTTTRYNNHLNQIKDLTLMYIDGKFQSNKTQPYPNITDYSYNGLNITKDFSGGNISYDLSGLLTSNINSGYKFIAFEIKKSTNAQSPEAYTFNTNTYNRILYDSKYYISIKSMLSSLFDNSTINNIFDYNSNEAIGFVRVTKTSAMGTPNSKKVGNLKISFDPTQGNWINTGNSTNVSYNSISNAIVYSCKVENDSNGDLGIYIDPTAIEDDLMLFIGLKNN